MTGSTCYHYLNWDCPICGKPISSYSYTIKKIGNKFIKVHLECENKDGVFV